MESLESKLWNKFDIIQYMILSYDKNASQIDYQLSEITWNVQTASWFFVKYPCTCKSIG